MLLYVKQRWGRYCALLEVPVSLSLCRYYGREIAAYDIQTKRVDVYGQDQEYTERAFILYDGLHYDALAQAGEQARGEMSNDLSPQSCLVCPAQTELDTHPLIVSMNWESRLCRK